MRVVYDVVADGAHDGSPDFAESARARHDVGGASVGGTLADGRAGFILGVLHPDELPFDLKMMALVFVTQFGSVRTMCYCYIYGNG